METATSNYLRKNEIVDRLKNLGVPDSELTSKTRDQLLTQLGQMEQNAQILADEAEIIAAMPSGTDSRQTGKSWTKQVLAMIPEEEKPNGHPTCYGLLYVFEDVCGEILDIEKSCEQTPKIENQTFATAKCTLRYRCKNTGTVKTVSDLADCSSINTVEPYSFYPSATAATMALGRCLRQAMRINVLVQEEILRPDEKIMRVSQDAISSAMKATDTQLNTIDHLIKLIGLSEEKFRAHMSGVNFSDMSYSDAQTVLRQLQEFNKDPSIVPESLFKE